MNYIRQSGRRSRLDRERQRRRLADEPPAYGPGTDGEQENLDYEKLLRKLIKLKKLDNFNQEKY
jgi:hypothetical protein